MTDKPLSETHPTLFRYGEYDPELSDEELFCDIEPTFFRAVKATTVDVAEYERLKEEFDNYKKVAGAVQFIDEFHRGVAEGERRAMERVKEALMECNENGPAVTDDWEKFCREEMYLEYTLPKLIERLGLGKEVRE